MAMTIGSRVTIRGLRAQRRLNGQTGRVVGVRGARLVVDVNGERLAFKRDNLATLRGVRRHCRGCQSAVTAWDGECGMCGGRELVSLRALQPPPTSLPIPDPPLPAQRSGSTESTSSTGSTSSGRTPLFPPRMAGVGGVLGISNNTATLFLFVLRANPRSAQHPSLSLSDVLHHLHTLHEPQGPPPASSSAIAALPTFPVDASFSASSACTVCLEGYTEGQTAVRMPCQHLFHKECLLTWLEQRNTCPVCRMALPDAEGPKPGEQRQEQGRV